MADMSNIWHIKLLAWTHDPAEKALILMRGPESHEEAVKPLRELLGLDEARKEERELVRRADHWAAALDRPQHPEELGRWPEDVHFWKEPEIVHPLAGDRYRLSELWEDSRTWIELATFKHLVEILTDVHGKRQASLSDQKAFLGLWRLAPEKSPKDLKLGYLWRLLPADSRVPDHSIWEHLSLCSAFATSFALNDTPVLLHVSLGPVQSFIEQARTLSDLWSGSHLLSYLSWRAMKPIAQELGPDVFVYPSLWAVPLVDAWLQTEMGVPVNPPWWKSHSDANPLFRAALPNVFVALVPERLADSLVERAREGVKKALEELAEKLVVRLLEDAGHETDSQTQEFLKAQVQRHLAGFPTISHAVVPFSVVTQDRDAIGKRGYKDLERLLQDFGGEKSGKTSHFLETPFWKLLKDKAGLSEEKEKSGLSEGQWEISDPSKSFTVRYKPNPGCLYPAIRELADVFVAMSKSVRAFEPSAEEGYRCDLCGERGWLQLPGQEELRFAPPGKRRGAGSPTLWKQLEGVPSWGRKGEHLCGRCALKRFWPTEFAAKVGQWQVTGGAEEPQQISRFVVSTHTMALARDLEGLLERWESLGEKQRRSLDELKRMAEGAHSVALPRRLADRLAGKNAELGTFLRRLPSLLEVQTSEEEEGGAASERIREVENLIGAALGRKPERYYALILMDGDGMGKWVSADPEVMVPLKEAWHSRLANYVQRLHGGPELLNCPRPGSAGHHQALSAALNAFALEVTPWVVEELFLGKVVYCGGDDLLAMVSVDDLLPCMFMLRCAFSGILPLGDKNAVWSIYEQLKAIQAEINVEGNVIARGFVRKSRTFLLRMMGGRATASMGAVVAHHQAPLSRVLRELRRAEKRAKENGRNSFCVRILKRSGGSVDYTASWGFGGSVPHDPERSYDPERFAKQSEKYRSPMSCLFELRDALALPKVSRRAVYQALSWLKGLPAYPGDKESINEYEAMLESLLSYLFARHGITRENFEEAGISLEAEHDPAKQLAKSIVDVALQQCGVENGTKTSRSVTEHLSHMLMVAEFLAREGRAPRPMC